MNDRARMNDRVQMNDGARLNDGKSSGKKWTSKLSLEALRMVGQFTQDEIKFEWELKALDTIVDPGKPTPD